MLRIRDVYPGSRILKRIHPGSRIQKTATKEKGGKKFVNVSFLATNITKLKVILFLNWREEKKFGPIYKEFYNFLPQKLSLKGPKREMFVAGIFTEIRPVWVGD